MSYSPKFQHPRVWHEPKTLIPVSYRCGYCGDQVTSEKGWKIINASKGTNTQEGGVFICPSCLAPTYFPPHNQPRFPGSPFGNSVGSVPEDINSLYEEARSCSSMNSFTAAVLLCRKILMNLSVSQGADESKPFVYYVDYLATNGFVPPHGRHWVDHIRKKGNEANHEVAIMDETTAKELLIFTEMMLKFIFEFPSMIPNETHNG